jgi:putative DNA primase/helicase
MNSDRIGIALKGRRNGNGWLVCCPCPNHGKGRGDRFPSLSVADGDDGRLLLRCFAGCQFADILDELKCRGLMEGPQPRRVPQLRYPPKPSEPEPDPDALKIWGATFDAHDGIVREYLDRRGIALMPQFVCCQNDPPAMVVAVQRPDGKIVAVQQTWLTPDGKKAGVTPQRITTGALGTGAVRLGAAAEVMGLAEGVETALSAMQLTGITVWASLGSARLHQVELPLCVKEVHIFVDNDEPGRAAARRAPEVHTRLGRHVLLRSPADECGDWNDFLNLIADRDGRDLLHTQSAEDAA